MDFVPDGEERESERCQQPEGDEAAGEVASRVRQGRRDADGEQAGADEHEERDQLPDLDADVEGEDAGASR